MLNIPMAEIVLKQPRVRALVSKSKTARMVEHVGVRVYGQACAFPIAADHEPDGFPTERAASFTERLSGNRAWQNTRLIR